MFSDGLAGKRSGGLLSSVVPWLTPAEGLSFSHSQPSFIIHRKMLFCGKPNPCTHTHTHRHTHTHTQREAALPTESSQANTAKLSPLRRSTNCLRKRVVHFVSVVLFYRMGLFMGECPLFVYIYIYIFFILLFSVSEIQRDSLNGMRLPLVWLKMTEQGIL